jgi:hypothetical protein
MVYREPVGMEPASGAGASGRADSSAHDRVCSRHPSAERAGCRLICSRSWVWPPYHGHTLENGALFWPRLSSPARWDAPLSSRKASSSPGAAARSRWKSARGVCGQHSPLPPLSATRAVSMEWQREREASPGECAAASTPDGSRTGALARLEPQRAPARLEAARATPTHRGEPVATRRRAALHSGRDPVPCAASALASLVARAAGSPCASSNSWSPHDQALRHPSTLCCLARVGDGLTPRLPATGFLLLGHLCRSAWHLMAFFPGFSSSSAFLAPHPADSSISHGHAVQF